LCFGSVMLVCGSVSWGLSRSVNVWFVLAVDSSSVEGC
jgi:hypothetical protein